MTSKQNSFHNLWPSIRKHVLSTKAFLRGLRSLWNPFETLLKPLGNALEMHWNPLETLLKHFETLWKPFRNVLKPFGTWKHFGNPLEMFCILFEKPLWKCWKNYSPRLHSPSTWRRMHRSTARYNFSFCRSVILPYDSVLIYLWLWKDQKLWRMRNF